MAVKIKKMINIKDLKTAPLFGFDLCGNSSSELLVVVRREQAKAGKLFVATPNPEFVVFASKRSWFKKTLSSAHILIPDGIGLVWASRLLSPKLKRLNKTITGVDFTLDLLSLAAKQGFSVYFLGAMSGVANRALEKMRVEYPGLKGWANSGPVLSIDFENGYWQGKSQQSIGQIVKDINSKKPDFLFVALGMGKQEKFIVDHLEKLKVKLAIGVGGAFDYLSLKTKRPPRWIRSLGLEWLYRLIKEPRRITRQLALVEFVLLTLRTFIKKTIKSISAPLRPLNLP